MPKIASFFLLLFALHAEASPAEAQRIKRGFELAAETWGLKMKMAADPGEREKLMASRPDPSASAAELWQQIAPSLKEDWTIPFAAFFLDLTRNLTVVGADGNTGTAFSEERKRILEVFTRNHIAKPGIAPFCVALADSGDPKSLPLLHKKLHKKPGFLTRIPLRRGFGWVEWARDEQEQPQTMDRAVEEFGVEAGDLPCRGARSGACVPAG